MREWTEWIKKHTKTPTLFELGDITLEPGRGTIPLDTTRFKKLSVSHETRLIGVVDGGSAPVFASHDIAVYLFTSYGSIFQNDARVYQTCEETSAVIKRKYQKIEVHIENKTEPVVFEECDTLQDAANEFRHAMELATARKLITHMDEDDMLLLDGSLVGTTPKDIQRYQALFSAAHEHHIHLLGIAKTTQLTTTNGTSVIRVLRSLEPHTTRWLYSGTPGDPMTHFVKLHPHARHIFRIDTLKKKELDIMYATEVLARYAKDPAFLGYPYPLVHAHTRAKINTQEIALRRAVLVDKIPELEEAASAHDTLDILGHP